MVMGYFYCFIFIVRACISCLDISVENCAICRNHIMDLCIECQAITATPGNAGQQQPKSKSAEDCTIAWGKCNVSFH